MDLEPKTTSAPVDFSNNFSGVPNTPPILNKGHQPPLFSIGVDTSRRPTSSESNKSSGPSSTNLQDVGGAHLTVEKKGGMNRSASSPALSQFLSLVPGSKAIGKVNIQVNVSGYPVGEAKSYDDSSIVDPPVKIHSAGSAASVLTKEPLTKHVRKEMQSLYCGGAVNKYGSLFRKPGLDHKVVAPKSVGSAPAMAPLPTFQEQEESKTTDNSIGQRFKKWITTSPVKQSEREKNAIFPSSF
ncbi:uncharacterized protein LOC117318606 [Pecten maximus]|uniref:uncharacterized protein LOC117318606 n=1 Tax=Pecten maximus TaxID=6579 RepID=UPI001458D323|nr:uncharacterized protein LOC117318606 [Pecten maximus]XP_033729461.1 uncharacterized protein LOC117318606 [Pecten maximus]